MTQKAGTTAQWERPWYAPFELPREGIQQVEVLKVLVETKMVQSKAEGRRLLQQERVWDCNVVELDTNDKPIVMLTKLASEERHAFAEPGNRWVIGNAKYVLTSRGTIFDPVKNGIIEFVLAPKNDPRCNSGAAARIVRWALGRFH